MAIISSLVISIRPKKFWNQFSGRLKFFPKLWNIKFFQHKYLSCYWFLWESIIQLGKNDWFQTPITIIFKKLGLSFHIPLCNVFDLNVLDHTWVGVHSTFHLHHTLELYVLQLGSLDYNYRQSQIERLWCHSQIIIWHLEYQQVDHIPKLWKKIKKMKIHWLKFS